MKWLTEWALTSSVLILIVLAARLLLREKLSARLRYALWAVVLARLLVPFQVELPAGSPAPLPVLASNLAPETAQWEEPSIPVFPQSSRPAAEYNGITFDLLEPGEIKPTNTSTGYYQRSQDGETITRYLDVWSPAQIAETVWGGGAALMALVLLASNLGFYGRLRKRRKPLEVPDVPLPVYTAEGLPSPCLFGLFRPAVYVTPGAAEDPDALRHILAHELTHYRHKDHIWSLLRILALALHWYNPLVWLAVVLSKRDGELACDEGAVARLGEEERIPYGRTLVDMVAQRTRPADLLSCSTAMTGGKKSIQERVAQLVKKPETVKAALFAAVAVVAVAAVFVFAGRTSEKGVTSSPEFDTFLAQMEEAQQINIGNPMSSSTLTPSEISDPEFLAQAKELLRSGRGVFKVGDDIQWEDIQKSLSYTGYRDGEKPEGITQEELEKMFFGHGCPLILFPAADRDLETANRYWLIPWEGHCLLVDWDTEREERSIDLLGSWPFDLCSQLKDLARQQGRLDRAALFGLDRFRAEVEAAVSIRYSPPPYSSQAYPDPITDEELLVLAKERLDNFVALDPDNVLTDWSEKWPFASRIILSDGERSAVYALLLGADNRTYLFSGEDGTPEIKPFARTKIETNVVGSIAGYARTQEELNRDPNYPRSMTREDLEQYTPEFLQAKGVTQLQGLSSHMEDAIFHIGFTTPTAIWLWYRGDASHDSVWVLALSKDDPVLDDYTLLSDQPVEVFNAVRDAGEDKHYEQLGPGAFAAFLRPADVISATAGDYFPGQSVTLDIQTLKDQLVRALYHQRSANYAYDEEKYGQYVLTIYVEKDVDYYLHDDGTDGLILSVGSEPDVVCMRHRILALPDRPIVQYVYSPELYRTIRNLFD